MKIEKCLLSLIFLALFLGGCRPFAEGDALPRKAVRLIQEMGSVTAGMPEFVGQATMAEVMLRRTVEQNGTVGQACRQADLIEPYLRQEFDRRTAAGEGNEDATAQAVGAVLSNVEQLRGVLNCTAIAAAAE